MIGVQVKRPVWVGDVYAVRLRGERRDRKVRDTVCGFLPGHGLVTADSEAALMRQKMRFATADAPTYWVDVIYYAHARPDYRHRVAPGESWSEWRHPMKYALGQLPGGRLTLCAPRALRCLWPPGDFICGG